MGALNRTLRCCLLAAVAASLPVDTAAPQAEPGRPPLPSHGDPNDWSAYYDDGVKQLRRNPVLAGRLFHWATRLAPDRAEPLYAQWVAFWMVDEDRWIGYLQDRNEVLRLPEVVRIDSLRYLAYLRNPFVHQGLSVLLYERLPGRFRGDAATKGWLAYAEGNLSLAAMRLGEAIAADSIKHRWLRVLRATTLVSLNQLDGALAEMEALLRQLRREDETAVARVYQSKELILYGIGLLQTHRRRTAQARTSFQEALAENLGFAPAHRSLAALATARWDAAAAVAALRQAVELDPDDPVLRLEYGNALRAAGQVPAAVAEFRLAVAREPWWAEPYFSLGSALEAIGSKDLAIAAYEQYVSRAPTSAVMLSTVRSKLGSLRRTP